MYRAAVFDMDGTILDTIGDLTDSVNHCLGLYGYPPVSEEAAAGALGNGAEHLIAELIPGGRGNPDYRKVVDEHIVYYEKHCTIKTRPYPGILKAMNDLKTNGVKMAIVSNKGDGAVRELAEHHFAGLVDSSVGERPGIRRKPAPDTVLEALRQMEVPPAEAVYVGDTEVDTATAENAGMPCILVSWGFRSRKLLESLRADHLVDDAEKMTEVILGEGPA